MWQKCKVNKNWFDSLDFITKNFKIFTFESPSAFWLISTFTCSIKNLLTLYISSISLLNFAQNYPRFTIVIFTVKSTFSISFHRLFRNVTICLQINGLCFVAMLKCIAILNENFFHRFHFIRFRTTIPTKQTLSKWQ